MMIVDPVQAGFKGAARRMASADLRMLADERQYPLVMLEALLDVESGGAGFDEKGRPKILPEPHVFFRTLPKGSIRDAAVRAGVAYQLRGARPYPVGSDANYARLATMCAISRDAALRSTSFGIGQVMGFNCEACGYDDVEDFVLDCMEGELEQFELVLRYLEHAGLQDAIRRMDTRAIARAYNGEGAVELYSGKLNAAIKRHGGPAPLVSATIKVPALRNPPVTTDSLNDAQWLQIRAGAGA